MTERLSASVSSSEVSLIDTGPYQLSILKVGAGTSASLRLPCHDAFTRAPCPKHSSQKSSPFLCLPSEQVEHLQNGVVCVSQMAYLPFRACIWRCAPHMWSVLILSSGPGFSPRQYCILVSFYIVDSARPLSGFSFGRRCSLRM